MEKIKILDISSYMIVPPTSGGAQRIVRPMTRLKPEDGIEVDMLYTAYEDNVEKSRDYLEKYPCICRAVGVKPDIDLSDERAMPEGFCSDVWRTMGMELKDMAVTMVKEKFYDIIQIEHSMMAWIVPYLRKESPDSKIVLDLHNAEYRVYEKWCNYAKPEDYTVVRDKYEKLYAWETMCWKWFDAAFTVSPVETELFQQITGCTSVYEVPTGGGIDAAEYEPKDENRIKPYDLLYLGTMEWYPNAQGLLWFIDNVLPKVVARRPETKLHIVGFGKPDGELVQIADEHPNITFWGQQEDDKHFFQGAKVFIVPLFIGAGARVKVPTAWASRVPVASTVFGPEGLHTVNGENICMTDEPEEYADNILKLLEDDNYHKKIADNAFETLQKEYSCEVCVEKLKKAYCEIRGGGYIGDLKQYHIDFISNLITKVDITGKTILEIGCGEGALIKYLAHKFQPRLAVGIEPLLSGEYPDKMRMAGEEYGVNWHICEGDAIDIRFPDNSFDVVISVATFEHIADLERVLSEIKRVLKPGGIFYTEYGPIWTGIIGHHCRNWIREEVLKIPAWGHLYMDKKEMHEYLVKDCTKEEADDICGMIYDDIWINRIGIKEMKSIFENSGMEVMELKENKLSNRLGWLEKTSVDEFEPQMYEKLKDRFTESELRTSSINLLLKKL